MTLKDAIALACAPFLFCLFAWFLPQWWRNERGLHTGMPPPSRSSSTTFWHAVVRTWGALAISILTAIPPAVVTEFVTDGPVYALCNALLGVVALMWLFVIPSVWLYNRPRFLVAPHLRAMPGWLAERRGAPVPRLPEPAKPGYRAPR